MYHLKIAGKSKPLDWVKIIRVSIIEDEFSFGTGGLDTACWILLPVKEDKKTSGNDFVLLIIGIYQCVG